MCCTMVEIIEEYILFKDQLTYKFLCSVDSHNRYVCVYARIVGNLQNVNVFSSGCESGDASCFVASVIQAEYFVLLVACTKISFVLL